MRVNKSEACGAKFLKGNGELINLIGSLDWSKTMVGDITKWPESLCSAVSICVSSKSPITLWWGDDFTGIYNDAFVTILGEKHPASLGAPGKEVWPEIWEVIGPMLEKVVMKGQAICAENQKLILMRNDFPTEGYFTFSNSPIYDEFGNVGGVFTIVTETTDVVLSEQRLRKLKEHDVSEQIKAQKKIEESEARLRMAIESTKLGTWEYNPLSGELLWSDECRKIYAIPPGHPIDFKIFSEHIHPDDKAFVESEIMKAMDVKSNGYYNIMHRILRFSDGSVRWIKAQGKVYFNADQQTERFIGTVADVTEEKQQDIKLRENELRLRLAIRAGEIGTFDWDIGNTTFQYSERLAHIFGYSNIDNLTQQDFVDRIHPEDRQLRLTAHEEAFKTGALFYEARIVWPDAFVRWVRLSGQVIFDGNGTPQRMYGTALDITEPKAQADLLEKMVANRTLSLQKKNEELKRSEERYHKMAEEVQDYAIILLDKDGTILNWNKGAEKIKGYREKEIVGQNFSVFYLEYDRENKLPQKLIHEAVTNGRAMHEGWRKRKDNSRFWGSIVITALHDEQNNVIGFTKVTRDLTERKLAEDALKQYTSELERKNLELEQFAYIASHDLQEPLRKIQTFTGALEKKLDDKETRKKYFDKINSSASRMADLIKSVLNYSRLSKISDEFTATDLNSVLENIKADYELLIDEKHAVLKNDDLPVVKGIPLQLSQLFANLISNSLKFSEAPPVITISSKILSGSEVNKEHSFNGGSEKYVELLFRDNGIGFDQLYAEKIFTIFQRLNNREAYAGTGIGLALCKRIVDNHRGYIKAKSELGKGAEFFVYLPYE